jgi:hypothetical protein
MESNTNEIMTAQTGRDDPKYGVESLAKHISSPMAANPDQNAVKT